MNLADNLKKMRKEHNLSQEQLAEKLGVSRQSVSKWESNQAYPEMDKMLQICSIFGINIDELLNQDVSEVNNSKQVRNNINKYIDDFLDFITKTIDMFSSMNFKEKIKCILEQGIVIVFLIIIFFIIGTICSSIFGNLFSFIPSSVYYSIYHVFEAIFVAVFLVFGIILVLHVFKIRYLDYYVIVKEDDVREEKEEVDEVRDASTKKIVLEKKKDKIIIRDPEHSGYRFIGGLLKFLLFLVKIFAMFIGVLFCLSLVFLAICFILSFMFVKTGLLFVGGFLSILSLLIINLIILYVIYNFIISKKVKKTKLFIAFIISLVVLGGSIGLISIGITEFEVMSSPSYITEEKRIPMEPDMFFINYYGDIEYIESDNSDIRVVYNHTEMYTIKEEESEDGGYYFTYTNDTEIMEMFRTIIQDINNKKIIDYSYNEIKIYTTKENIRMLKNNLNNYFHNEEEREEVINAYEETISELNRQIEEKDNVIYELENNCNTE